MGGTYALLVEGRLFSGAGAIADYARIETAGWKGKEGTALADRDRQSGFYRSVMECFSRLGLGRIYRFWFGDRIALGISHPCTTFDKWRWMAIVDDRYDVVDALVTWF